jgi:hypothetical protein
MISPKIARIGVIAAVGLWYRCSRCRVSRPPPETRSPSDQWQGLALASI